MSFDDFDDLCVPLPCPGCGGKGVTFAHRFAVGPIRSTGLASGRADTVAIPARCGECRGRGQLHRHPA